MPEPPLDPFSATHTGCVAVLQMFRDLREAGGGWVESALLVAAQVAVAGTINEDGGGG
jgi:hypothetical protein